MVCFLLLMLFVVVCSDRDIKSCDELTSLPENLFAGLYKLTSLSIIINPKLQTLPVGLFRDNTEVTLL